MRLVVALIILAIAAIAVTVSFLAKPAGATVVCNPTIPIDFAKQRFKGVQKV